MARPRVRQSSVKSTFELRRRPRWGRRLLFFVLLLGIIVFATPIVISRTNLRNHLIPTLVPDLAATVDIGQANFSWLSPATLDNITILSPDGELLIEAAHIETEKSLAQMAIGFRDIGTVTVVKPRVMVVLNEQGTNFDSLIESLSNADDDDANDDESTSIGFGVQIVEGEIHIQDQATGEMCQLDQLTVHVRSPQDVANPIEVQLAVNAHYQQKQGTVIGDFSWNRPRKLTDIDLGNGELKIESRAFPFAALATAFRRANLDLTTTGDLFGNIQCRWTQGPSGPELTAEGLLSAAQTQLAMPSVFGQDTLRSEMLTLSLNASVEKQQLNLAAVNMDCEFGNIQLSGTVPLSELFDQDLGQHIATYASRHQLAAKGRVDLRQLAAALPNTLRLREDTSLVGGELEVALTSQSTAPEARQFKGRLTTQDIVAASGGKTITWKQPMEVDFSVDSQPAGYAVERFACRSDFLEADASGTLTAGSFQATGDLDKLANQLHQLCDLGNTQIAGRFNAQGDWSTAANQTYVANSRINVEDFQLVYGDTPPWQERQLSLTLAAEGQASGTTLVSLNSLDVRVVSDPDQLVAQLTAPVQNPSSQSVWPVNCHVQGQLQTWLSRLRPWVATDQWQLTGQMTATAIGEISTASANLSPCTLELTDLIAISGERQIREPTVRLSGNAIWDASRGIVSVPDLEAISSTIALRGKDIRVTTGEELQAAGAAAFRGDLGRISALLQNPNQPMTSDYRGNLQGTVQVATQNGVIGFNGTSTCAEFAMLTRKTVPTVTLGPQSTWTEAWREAQLNLAATGQFLPKDSTLQLERVQLSGDVAQVQASGAIRNLLEVPIADLTGEIEYDLYGIVAKLKNWIGTGFELVGRKKQPFTVRGPLALQSVQIGQAALGPMMRASATAPLPTTASVVSRELSAEAGVGWDRASAYGVDFGPQQISLLLNQGVLSTSPIESKLVGGLVALSPRLEVGSYPMMLVLDEKTKIQGVQITPQMCDDWIKYVAPLMAGTATAEGQFSATISTARVPLDNPMLADASGVVTIENAKVQPGPTAQQLLGALREAATLAKTNAPNLSFLSAGNNWLTIQQQSVEFQMTQGRVYHRNLTLNLGDVAVQTSGWVAADQSMSVVAQIPIQDGWVKNEPLLAGLSGQMIQIPIHGTLSAPQLDKRAFAQLTQQIVGSTAERYLHTELEKGLKKLLGPK